MAACDVQSKTILSSHPSSRLSTCPRDDPAVIRTDCEQITNVGLYHPSFFRVAYDAPIRCHTTPDSAEPALRLNVRCAVAACFATTTLRSDGSILILGDPITFDLRAREQDTLEWHDMPAEIRMPSFVSVFDSPSITPILGDDRCAGIQEVVESKAWDAAYSHQEGAFVVTLIACDADAASQSGSGGGATMGDVADNAAASISGDDKGEAAYALQVDVLTDREIKSPLCQVHSQLSNFELLRRTQLKMQASPPLRFMQIAAESEWLGTPTGPTPSTPRTYIASLRLARVSHRHPVACCCLCVISNALGHDCREHSAQRLPDQAAHRRQGNSVRAEDSRHGAHSAGHV